MSEYFIAVMGNISEIATLADDLPPGWIMLDSGASRSVASLKNLTKMQEVLIEEFGSDLCSLNKDEIHSFRFGNGTTLDSVGRVRVPATIAGIPGLLHINGIDDDQVPTLMGIDAMAKIGLSINFSTGQVSMEKGKETIPVHSMKLTSGHIAINLLEGITNDKMKEALWHLTGGSSREPMATE